MDKYINYLSSQIVFASYVVGSYALPKYL